MARIGIFGGSFNPPHNGHIQAAGEAVRALQLDRLLIVPAAQPPHKQLPPDSPSPAQRLELCKAAFAGLEKVEVSPIELQRHGLSYTYQTLPELQREYPGDELYLLMGTDMLLSFRSWVQPESIAAAAKLAVLYRTEKGSIEEQRLQQEAEALQRDLGAQVLAVGNERLPLSSTEVRCLIALDAAKGTLPPEVLEEICKQGWYGCGRDRKNLPYAELEKASLALHKPKRALHALGCAELAERLAQHWGADPVPAKRAGILHDVTKALDTNAQLRLCSRYGILCNNFEKENPKLLHAKTGAAVAREIFGEVPEVCDAILWHTTGKAAMTLPEKILYIADYAEPTRDFDGVELLRKLIWTDLDAALLEGFRMSLELLRSRGKAVDDNSRQAWEYLRTEREGLI